MKKLIKQSNKQFWARRNNIKKLEQLSKKNPWLDNRNKCPNGLCKSFTNCTCSEI